MVSWHTSAERRGDLYWLIRFGVSSQNKQELYHIGDKLKTGENKDFVFLERLLVHKLKCVTGLGRESFGIQCL